MEQQRIAQRLDPAPERGARLMLGGQAQRAAVQVALQLIGKTLARRPREDGQDRGAGLTFAEPGQHLALLQRRQRLAELGPPRVEEVEHQQPRPPRRGGRARLGPAALEPDRGRARLAGAGKGGRRRDRGHRGGQQRATGGR